MKRTALLFLTIQFLIHNSAFAEPTAVSNPVVKTATQSVSATTNPPVTAETPAQSPAQSQEPMVFVHKIKQPMNKVYKRLFTTLENNGYFILFEPNIGRNLAHFAKRWGKDYNKNKLEQIRSMVFCNGWYANQVSNYDPDMLALCPLHLTLTAKEGVTSILFVRPSQVSRNSAANTIATELEQDIVRIIKESSR